MVFEEVFPCQASFGTFQQAPLIDFVGHMEAQDQILNEDWICNVAVVEGVEDKEAYVANMLFWIDVFVTVANSNCGLH